MTKAETEVEVETGRWLAHLDLASGFLPLDFFFGASSSELSSLLLSSLESLSSLLLSSLLLSATFFFTTFAAGFLTAPLALLAATAFGVGAALGVEAVGALGEPPLPPKKSNGEVARGELAVGTGD